MVAIALAIVMNYQSNVATQDERRLWEMGLGGERRALRAVSSPHALELAWKYPCRFTVCIHGQALPQQLVPHHFTFRPECILPFPDPGPRSRFGVDEISPCRGNYL